MLLWKTVVYKDVVCTSLEMIVMCDKPCTLDYLALADVASNVKSPSSKYWYGTAYDSCWELMILNWVMSIFIAFNHYDSESHMVLGEFGEFKTEQTNERTTNTVVQLLCDYNPNVTFKLLPNNLLVIY